MIEYSAEAADGAARSAMRALIEAIDPNPVRAGLIETPGRWVRALHELLDGYDQDTAAILSRTFPESYDEMVVVSGIEFVSLCEHHVLPFTGTAAIGYLPRGHVVGLSKLPRLVEAVAHRLQLQERMTQEVAHAIEEHLRPSGVGVIVRATHSCMALRGVRKPEAAMTTSCMLGSFREQPETRQEFMRLVNGHGMH